MAAFLVTGANRGLGLEFIRQLQNLSPKPKYIFAACRSPESAAELKEISASDSSVKLIKLDVTDESTIKSARQEVETILEGEGLNCLVNNAGVMPRSSLDEVTAEGMVENYKINAVGPLMVAKAFLPMLKKASKSSKEKGMSYQKASIINISTGAGSIGDNRSGGIYEYRASKAAMNMLTVNMSIDLKAAEILVVAIYPGWVQTDLGGKNAKLTTEQSVAGMLNEMKKWNAENTGTFPGYNGKILPW